ncbi:MAG: substrate-binding periplasmic protein [Luteibaculum sp.]
MKKSIVILLFSLFCSVLQANNDSSLVEQNKYPAQMELQIKYVDRAPFFFNQGKDLSGIEQEILGSFVAWAKLKKGVQLRLKYKSYKDFSSFYEACKSEESPFIGAGTVTMSQNREEIFDFSGPYLNNISVLVSAGWVPTLKSLDDLSPLSNFHAYTTANSVHEEYLTQLANNQTIKIKHIKEQQDLPNYILADSTVFGYMDVLNFWDFHKKNPTAYIKIHRSANKRNESFGFISKKGDMVSRLLKEFFDSGFGFTATKQYRQILEKYLGYEVIEAVEVNEW